ncbi:MAG: hypothetical protein J0H43_12920, partial [Actinobacteria bacterium]|nr:hypothetical protein [Actinomycetota bacterium]
MTPTADGHLHVFAGGYPAVRSLVGPEVGVYEGLRAEHGIVEALVVGYEGATFAAGNNEYLRSLAANRDWMHTTAYVDARADVTAALARDIVAAGHVGVSLYATEDGLAQAIRRWSVEFWTECNRARMIVSVNAAPESIGLLAELPPLAPDCS